MNRRILGNSDDCGAPNPGWLQRLSPSSACTCCGEVTAEGYVVEVIDPFCVWHNRDRS